MDFPSSVSARWPRCPPGKREQLAGVRPAVGLGHFFPDPSAVPTDPDGLLAAVYQLVEDPNCAPIAVGDTVQDRAFMLIDGMLQTVPPAEVRAALYRALAKIPGVKAEVARRRRRRPKSAKNAAASHGSIARSAPSAPGPPPEAAMHSQALPNPAPAGNAQGNPSELRDCHQSM